MSPWRTLPNQLTAFRILLTCALPLLAPQDRWLWLATWSCAKATDVLDGHLARRLSLATPFGRHFDSLADFFLSATNFVLLWHFEPRLFTEHAAAWLAGLASVVIVEGAAWWRWKRPAALHLHSSRLAGGTAFFGFGSVVAFGYSPLVVPLFISVAIIRNLEVLSICLLVRDPYRDPQPSVFLYARAGE